MTAAPTLRLIAPVASDGCTADVVSPAGSAMDLVSGDAGWIVGGYSLATPTPVVA